MISRRKFLRRSSQAGVAMTAAGAGLESMFAEVIKPSAEEGVELSAFEQRARRSFEIRCDSAWSASCGKNSIPATNGDEERYLDKRASFAKSLPHNDLGEVEPHAYNDWLSILASGDSGRFEEVPRDPSAVAKLNNPQATYAFDLVGIDSHATHLPPPPAFASDTMAIETAEVYWQALTIDVPFQNYETNALITAALSDLNAFSHPVGSSPAGKITARTLFRGETVGDLIGPYISQFLWLDVPYGIKTFDQRYRSPLRDQKFLTEFAEWLACQRGAGPATKLKFDLEPRYICSSRELAEYVHQDFSFQTYLNAALIMLRLGREALNRSNPCLGSKAQGQLSRLIARSIERVAAQVPDLGLTLCQPGVFLDIGTGVGWLAIEAARAWPALRVVGIDFWEPALNLARKNLTQSGVADRVEFRLQRIEQLDDDAVFMLAWLPGPFIAAETMVAALERVYQALKPGGWLVFGFYPAAPNAVGQLLTDLRIVRGGGHPWTTQEVKEQLGRTGFQRVEASSPFPSIVLLSGQRPDYV